MKIPFMTLCQCFYSSREEVLNKKEEKGEEATTNSSFFSRCSKNSKKLVNYLVVIKVDKQKKFALDAMCAKIWRNLCIDNHLGRTLTEMQKGEAFPIKNSQDFYHCIFLERDSPMMNKVSVGRLHIDGTRTESIAVETWHIKVFLTQWETMHCVEKFAISVKYLLENFYFSGHFLAKKEKVPMIQFSVRDFNL